MATVYDVEANELIERAAMKLAGMGIAKPAYLDFVKSGAHAQRRPQQGDFWHLRCASLLRKAYLSQGRGIGVNRLRVHYGGRKKRGAKPEKKRKASGSIIRRAFFALEKAGLLQRGKKGRGITAAGMKFLDGIAGEIIKKGG